MNTLNCISCFDIELRKLSSCLFLVLPQVDFCKINEETAAKKALNFIQGQLM